MLPPASTPNLTYRGRLAPSPTGYLHLGHAKTFWTAQERARQYRGQLIMRNEDLDRARCKAEFVTAMVEDLRWFGLDWSEGLDCGGPFAPYNQSERLSFYREIFDRLQQSRAIYPCFCSRKDVQAAVTAPHAADDEPIYPGTCRNRVFDPDSSHSKASNQPCWRFRVPDGEVIAFNDENLGPQEFRVGRDFGDFVVWRPDDIPAYQLACVADDYAMEITEVVRGADLLVSTARQLLLYRVLGWNSPKFYHCALMLDEQGRRLAKRHDDLSLRQLRARQINPETLRKNW